MSDYNFLMESRLSPEQFRVVGHLSRVAAEQGLNLYLVGGAVRDLTYGQQMIRDLDFSVEGNPQKILRRLERSGEVRGHESGTASGKPGPLDVAYGHLNARLISAEFSFTNGVRCELSMCRNETYTRPRRSPEISPAAIFDDLRRRDLSVNAMAVSLHPNSRGLLLDPTNGAADIDKRELRALHSRSFLEDPSRIYRLLRLSLRLNFKPEERTKRYLEAALENRLWERLGPDQQGRELRGILQEENPGQVLRMLDGRGLLVGLDKKLARVRIPFDRFARTRSVARAVAGADAFLLNFHVVVEKLGNSQRRRLAKKVILDRKAARMALNLERDARKLARVVSGSRAALPSQVYTLLARVPQPLLLFLLVYYPQIKVQKRVKNYLFKYPQIRARLPRGELQALGLKPGPKFEKILRRIFFDQLDGKIKTHQQLVKTMRALAGIKEPAKVPAVAASGASKKKKK